ncbi:hypothetical protein DFH07DRAFT_972716 [Mycena maculata]|uniref:F-box domain-containing protein n=1 Tax=Mycena maculata TaxID=230809 RepID=A0AAD7HGB4_9AGAR|nr:hypothetical protein DFH07DRAFT_972716 [Mycena maculata]
MFGALPVMSALTKVTLRLDAPIPAELFRALSSVPHLTILEIHQVRFDGTSPPPSLPFAALESLLICIYGFQGVIRGENIDHAREIDNVFVLLKNLSDRLTQLQISGDVLGSGFPSLRWLRLQKFSITEHTPTPFIPVPELISGMPALRDLSILFSADLTRDSADLYPPFRLGIPGGELLTLRSPLLATITLSNLEPADPIFAQLPRSLESLHLLAMGDWYIPGPESPPHLREAPFTGTTAVTAIQQIAHLQDLSELSLTLEEFPTADLIHCIAAVFPRLRFLQLGHVVYSHGRVFCPDVRDESIPDALERLPHLTHLRISLDFVERQFQEGPQKCAARWLLQRLPCLCTVAFSWEQSFRYSGFETVVWRIWDRSVLLPPPPPQRLPSPPPSPTDPEMGRPIPPWELAD